MTRRGRPFAVEVDRAQLAWPDRVRTVEGLAPGATTEVDVDGERITVTTLRPPPGEELTRIATISDVHVGCRHFGVLELQHEPPGDPISLRCLRSATADAVAWGAQLLVVKGDLTHRGRPEEWQAAAEVLRALPIPVVVVAGNHEVKDQTTHAAVAAGAAAGLDVVSPAGHIDLPGVRVVLLDTAEQGMHPGTLERAGTEALALVRAAPGPALVLAHHQLQRSRVPTYWPPGVPGPAARRFLTELRAANPSVLLSTGHTHRHRRHRWQGVTWTEVGSTKDHPGTWAGYAVHEGGIRQVVSRVSDPGVQAWLWRTRRAAGGAWGLWSPGRLHDRCFSLSWPR